MFNYLFAKSDNIYVTLFLLVLKATYVANQICPHVSFPMCVISNICEIKVVILKLVGALH